MIGRRTLFAMSMMLAAPLARADAPSDAKDLFERGRELRASGDCRSAVPLFHKAYDVFPRALGSLRNAAECEELTGLWASSRRSWLDLGRALLLSHDAKYTGWDADVETATHRLASRVAHLTVDVSPSNGELEVTVNGEVLPHTLVGTVLDRDPGKYVVRAHIGAGAPAEQTFDLVTGETRTARLVVALPGQPLPPQPRSDTSSPSSLAPAGWVTLSIGIAALAGMGVAIAVRQDALSSLTDQCPDTHLVLAVGEVDRRSWNDGERRSDDARDCWRRRGGRGRATTRRGRDAPSAREPRRVRRRPCRQRPWRGLRRESFGEASRSPPVRIVRVSVGDLHGRLNADRRGSFRRCQRRR